MHSGLSAWNPDHKLCGILCGVAGAISLEFFTSFFNGDFRHFHFAWRVQAEHIFTIVFFGKRQHRGEHLGLVLAPPSPKYHLGFGVARPKFHYGFGHIFLVWI